MKQWENVTRSNVCVHQHHYHHRENFIQIYSHSSTNNRQKLYADCNGSMGMGEKVLYKGKTENCFLYFVFFSFCCCSSIFFHFVVCELTRIYSIVRAPNVCDENENQGPTEKNEHEGPKTVMVCCKVCVCKSVEVKHMRNV